MSYNIGAKRALEGSNDERKIKKNAVLYNLFICMTLLEGPELIGKAYSALAWSLEIFMNYHILTVKLRGAILLIACRDFSESLYLIRSCGDGFPFSLRRACGLENGCYDI